MSVLSPIADARTAESLIRDLQRLAGTECPACGEPLSHRHALMSIALGFKDAPRCLPCLSTALGGDLTELREQLFQYVQRQDCFRTAWEWACKEEGVKPDELPALSKTTPRVKPPERVVKTAPPPILSVAVAPSAVHAEWDAGDLGCGELVLDLRLRLQALRPGQIFKLCARDPGAPEDLPAWCRLTGHQLVRAEPPYYWIKRKD